MLRERGSRSSGKPTMRVLRWCPDDPIEKWRLSNVESNYVLVSYLESAKVLLADLLSLIYSIRCVLYDHPQL